MVYTAKERGSVWDHHLGATPASVERGLAAERVRLLTRWSKHPWLWFSGVDTTTTEGPDGKYYPGGRPLIFTADEKNEDADLRPFPAEKEYLEQLTSLLWGWKPASKTSQAALLGLDKARQMYCSTLSLGIMDWVGRFRKRRRMLVSRSREKDAIELLEDKVRRIHSGLPEWVRAALPQKPTPMEKVVYPHTRWGGDSYILGVPQNAAIAACRGGASSIVLIDEAAFQDYLGEMLTAVLPMASRVWMITTANIGNAGAKVFLRYKEGGGGGIR